MLQTISCLISIFITSDCQTTKPYNILFVVSDDLRADIGGYYGQNNIISTPNINAFQQRAFTFTHAYTQQAVCAATRASFLTGTRPDTTRIWTNGPYFRDTMINGSGKNVITLPEYFKKYGNYHAVGSGKIFHPGKASGGTNKCNMGDDAPYSWSEPYWDCEGCTATAEVQSPAQNQCKNGTGCVQSKQCLDCLNEWNCYFPNKTRVQLMCPADCDDDCFPDPDVAEQTLAYFKKMTTDPNLKDKPFFIAAGFRRPHSGQYAPLRFYEKNGYNDNYSNISIAKHTRAPYNMPIQATTNCSVDVCGWSDVIPHLITEPYINPPNNKSYNIQYVNESFHAHIRGAYYSTLEFMDEQFGKLIKGLNDYNLWNNTVVIFTGDHGWHLGEQGLWAKYTCFEVATRVPLMIRIPGLNEGMKSDVLVEQLDMFPTLIEASGVGFINESNISKQLEGKSLLNLIQNPSHFEDYYAYSQYPRPAKVDPTIMGISMRTTMWRYTEWIGFYPGTNTSAAYPLWNITYGVELYNHSNLTVDENDLNGYDNYNLAYNDSMKSIVDQLHDQLYKTWDNQSWAINNN